MDYEDDLCPLGGTYNYVDGQVMMGNLTMAAEAAMAKKFHIYEFKFEYKKYEKQVRHLLV